MFNPDQSCSALFCDKTGAGNSSYKINMDIFWTNIYLSWKYFPILTVYFFKVSGMKKVITINVGYYIQIVDHEIS